jgi:DNA polymerase I-like protein with 3'-5' exonuclease and polymerase domains
MPRKFKLDESDNLCGTLFAPDSGWVPPPSFPDLSGERRIGIDIETRDPDLHTRGPGFIRGDASVVGISVAASDKSWYYPFGHLGGGNVEKEPVIRWVRDLVSSHDRYIVGANLQYELEGLSSLGIEVASKTLDIQVAEALINEEKDHYALEYLAREYLGSGKDETLLRDAASAYGVDPKSGLWKLPSKYVGPYAEYDALAALRVFEKQFARLREDGLLGIFELESKLLPILWQMRKQGIPIDMDAAAVLSRELKKQEEDLRLALIKSIGYDIDVWSGDQISRYCDKVDIRYPRTPKGNPSFTGDWLDTYSDPGIQLIAKVREVNRMKSTFVDKWIFQEPSEGQDPPTVEATSIRRRWNTNW